MRFFFLFLLGIFILFFFFFFSSRRRHTRCYRDWSSDVCSSDLFGGRVQRELGQEQFTRVVRHAYDRGIRFFETADAYTGMPQMLAEALRGVPRDSYKLMTKFRLRDAEGDQKATIDRLRRDLNSEYFDILLMHCVRSPKWPEETQKLQDTFSEVKQKKVILAHGASVHGLLPLRAFPGYRWLDV